MSFLAPLLEAQDLDRAIDAARQRAAELPERKSVSAIAEKIAAAEARLQAARSERVELEASEGELDRAVAQIAKDIEAAELERYSGKRKDRDAAEAHEASQQALREKQEGLETQEMELLESMEAVDLRIEEVESLLSTCRNEAEQVALAIRKVESEVEAEVAGLKTSRAALEKEIPEPVLAAYERVRAQPRSGGRGATSLTDGRCMGCRIQLPSLEKTRMLGEPEDALIQCPQCRKVLVRE